MQFVYSVEIPLQVLRTWPRERPLEALAADAKMIERLIDKGVDLRTQTSRYIQICQRIEAVAFDCFNRDQCPNSVRYTAQQSAQWLALNEVLQSLSVDSLAEKKGASTTQWRILLADIRRLWKETPPLTTCLSAILQLVWKKIQLGVVWVPGLSPAISKTELRAFPFGKSYSFSKSDLLLQAQTLASLLSDAALAAKVGLQPEMLESLKPLLESRSQFLLRAGNADSIVVDLILLE